MAKKKAEKGQAQTATVEKVKIEKPPKFAVVILNDDFTPMEFVIQILVKFFQKNEQQATTIMLSVHKKGKGICGIYSKEIAETKANQVLMFARENQHPLQCKIEEA